MTKLMILFSMVILYSCVKSENSKITNGASLVTYKRYFNCTNTGAESTAVLYTFYSSGDYVYESMYYSANNCTAASGKERNYILGKYTYNKDTGMFSEQPYKLSVAYLTNAEVAYQNGQNQCGFNNWQINVLKDITDNDDCMGGTIYSNTAPLVYSATLNDSVFMDGTTTFNRVVE